jgi:hypothetical protein
MSTFGETIFFNEELGNQITFNSFLAELSFVLLCEYTISNENHLSHKSGT